MWLSSTIAAAVVLGGTLASYLYEDEAHPAWRLCAGAVSGLAAFGLIALILACIVGLNPFSIAVAVATLLSPIMLLTRQVRRTQLRADIASVSGQCTNAASWPRRALPLVCGVAVAALVGVILDRVMFERSDGIYTGVANNLGDLPFHIGAITRFAWGNNFPPEHPSYAGAPFTYPFIADLIAAVFVSAGSSLRGAFILENVILAFALIGLLARWSFELTQDRVATCITVLLIFAGGGLGWVMLATDISESNSLQVLLRLPHDYTVSGTDWRWGNMVTALLLPQRSLLLGLPLAILTFTLLWKDVVDAEAGGSTLVRRRIIAAGILTSMLPLVHAHSYAVVVGMAAVLALVFNRVVRWLPFFLISVPLGAAQVLWISAGSQVQSDPFVIWQVGWDHGNQNILWFWIKNTGLTIPLLVVAYLWRGRNAPVPRRLWLFYAPFTLCFLVPNVLKLAPWIWDNIKILLYWHVASAPLVALVLARLWHRRGIARAAAVLITVSLTLSGTLDVWRVISRAVDLRIFTREGIEFAALVRQKVPPQAIIVHAPTYNHPVFLAGRRSLMGYAGHVWSHGIAYGPREEAIRRIYAGSADADNDIARLGIGYLVLGPLEREQLKAKALLSANYRKVAQIADYELFQVGGRSR
jgi:hypothetical protein